MTLEELFKGKDFQLETNIELALYKLAEELGTPKEDILSGVHDLKFTDAKLSIFKHIKKFMGVHQ